MEVWVDGQSPTLPSWICPSGQCFIIMIQSFITYFHFLQRDIQSDKSDLCQASLQALGHCLYQEQIARWLYLLIYCHKFYYKALVTCSRLIEVKCLFTVRFVFLMVKILFKVGCYMWLFYCQRSPSSKVKLGKNTN